MLSNILAVTAAAVFTAGITSAQSTSGAYEVCSGAGANPLVYNFELNGYPAKIFMDAELPSPLEGGFFADPVPVLQRALRRRFEDDSDFVLYSNILYTEIDGEGVLVDAGNGPDPQTLILGPGNLFDQLEGESISRDFIKHLLITHAHPDHIIGLVTDIESLEPAFPNAKIYVSRLEYEHWMADQVDNGTSLLPPVFNEGLITTAQKIFTAVDDQIELFEAGAEPIPGFRSIHTPWHTPGHMAYAIKDGNGTLLLTGDAVVDEVLAIENPWVTLSSDFDTAGGASGRYEFLDMAVKERWQLLAYHTAFPGLLYVDNQGVNFQYTRAPYVAGAGVRYGGVDEVMVRWTVFVT